MGWVPEGSNRKRRRPTWGKIFLMKIWQKWKSTEIKPYKWQRIILNGKSLSPNGIKSMSGMNKIKPIPHVRCSRTYHVEVNGTVQFLLLLRQRQHLFVDARNQDVALRVHHATHQLHQVCHRLVSVNWEHNTITLFMLKASLSLEPA